MSATSTRGIHRASHRLADGREIVYFDDSAPYADGSAEREVRDTRPLDRAERAGEMRLDPLTGEWVAMAAHRLNRTFMPPADECPLCPSGRGTVPSEVPSEDYDVVVFENRFPSFSSSPDAASGLVDGQALWPVEPAAGRCEVICFSSDHATSFGHLTAGRVRTVVEAWADRTAELSALPAVRQVFPFENRGREIGVTLHHPHGQIYAYPYVTPRTAVMLDRAGVAPAGDRRRRCWPTCSRPSARPGRAWCCRGEHWTAYVPAAARWPVEVHLAPHRDVPDLAALDAAERDELAVVYLELMQRARPVLPRPGRPGAAPAVHRRLAPGPARRAARARTPAPAGVLGAARPGTAEVPRGVRVRDGRVGERHHARADRRPPARGRRLTRTEITADDLSADVREAFGARWGGTPDGVWRAPGRVNVIGEHVDYQGGLCLPIALPHSTFAAVRLRDDDVVRLHSLARPDDGWEGALDDIGPGSPSGWAGYLAGVLWALREDGVEVPGVDVAVASAVPLGAGLSSSASLECSLAVAVAERLGLPTDDDGRARLAAACVRAENEVAMASTGGLDQAASLRAVEGNALLVDCRDGSVDPVPFRLEAAGLVLLVVDTRAPHRLVDSEYAARRVGLRARGRAARRADAARGRRPGRRARPARRPGPGAPRAARRHRDRSGARGRRRCCDADRPADLGPLLAASHASLRDDYEVSSPELDLVVETSTAAGALGARMTGGGFGGSAVVLVEEGLVGQVEDDVAEAFDRAGWETPGFVRAVAGPAARSRVVRGRRGTLTG